MVMRVTNDRKNERRKERKKKEKEKERKIAVNHNSLFLLYTLNEQKEIVIHLWSQHITLIGVL